VQAEAGVLMQRS